MESEGGGHARRVSGAAGSGQNPANNESRHTDQTDMSEVFREEIDRISEEQLQRGAPRIMIEEEKIDLGIEQVAI